MKGFFIHSFKFDENVHLSSILTKMSKKIYAKKTPNTCGLFFQLFFFAPGLEPVTTRPNVNQYLQHHVKRTNRNSALVYFDQRSLKALK